MPVPLFAPRRAQPAGGPGDAGVASDVPRETTLDAKASARKERSDAPPARHSYAREAAALLLIASALYTALALGSFQADPLRPEITGADWVGPVGAELAGAIAGSIGVVAWLLPIELVLLALPLLNSRPSNASLLRGSGDIVVAAVLAALAHVAFPEARAFGAMPLGGAVGELFGEILRVLFSTVGSYIIGLTVVGLILVGRATFSFIELARRIERFIIALSQRGAGGLRTLIGAWTTAKDIERRQTEDPGRTSDPLIGPQSSPDAIIAALTEGDVTPDPRTPPREVAGAAVGPSIAWSEMDLAWKASPADTDTPTPAPAPRREKRPRAESKAAALPIATDGQAASDARPLPKRKPLVEPEPSPPLAREDEAQSPIIIKTAADFIGDIPTPSPVVPTRTENDRPARTENERPAHTENDRPARGSGGRRARTVKAELARASHDTNVRSHQDGRASADDGEPARVDDIGTARAEDSGALRVDDSRTAYANDDAPSWADDDETAQADDDEMAHADDGAPTHAKNNAFANEDDDEPAQDDEVSSSEEEEEEETGRSTAIAPVQERRTTAAGEGAPRLDRPKSPKLVDTTAAIAPKKPDVVRVVPAVGQGFRLPMPDMLEPAATGRLVIDEQQLKLTAQLLEKTLADYGVSGKVEEIHPGPTVTTFEVSPAAGTKVSKVAGLADDLALGLSRKVRIVAPIPGKNRIGFEIPNEQRVPVSLRELIEDRRFLDMNAPLPCVLGRDIIGAPYFADLASMPHVIVAGATGAGKSVGLNVMLVSLLFRRTPEDLRLLMIDPKVVELAPFDRIPHMLLPVVTDMKQAANALKWAVDEMERRYQLFANAGTKNITTYNAWVAKVLRGEARPPKPPAKVAAVGVDGTEVMVDAAKDGSDTAMPEKLPFIVIVVDEFADLMMQQGKDVEASVARLAQKARAAGMHVILATQRPSVDVITGMIKANFPTRIAFRVAQKVDSRTILDEQGAEHLLGRGDMLIKMNGANDTRRVQCPFCSEEEVQRITDFLRLQGEPVYDEAILRPRDEDGEEQADTSDAEADPMYDAACRIVAETRRCSTSWIQRKLGVGYNRAAKIVEAMEKHGLVGPANGAKDREVLISAL